MTKQDFGKMDLRPKLATMKSIINGLQEIDRKNKAFKKKYKR